jgi:hypothetical protein
MSNDLAVSMAELESESAELLPSRETLCYCNYGHKASGGVNNSFNFTQVAVGGNTSTGGFLSPAILDGNAINLAL